MLRVSNWLKDPLSRHIRNELIKLQPEPMEIEMQFSSDIDWQDSKVDFLGRSLLQNCLWITSSQKNGYPLQIQTNGALHFGKDRQELQQNSHISSEGILDLALFMVSDLNSGKSSFRTQLKNLDKSVLQQIFLQIVPVTGYGQYLVRHFGYGDLSGNLYGEYHAAGGDMLIQDIKYVTDISLLIQVEY